MKRHLQCAEQQVSRSNLTKYCACHEKWVLCLIRVTYETSFPMRGATGVTIQPHQILRLPRKMTRQNFRENLQKQVKRHFQCGDDPSMIRPWSENNPTMKPTVHNPPRKWGYFSNSPRAFSIEKYNVSRPILHSNIHQMLHPPQKVALELHQILHLPWKVTLVLHQVLHLPQKVALELHQILRLTRKVTLELHQVLRLARKVTLELHQVLHLPQKVALELHQVLRPPRKVKLELHQVLHLPRKVTLELHQVLHLPRKVTLEFHQVLRLPRKVTLEFHQMLRLSRRKTHMLNPHHISNLIYNARSNRCPPPTSANTAPATKIDTAKFQWKCPKTGETSFPMRGRSEHDPTMIRAWSDHDPTMKPTVRNPPRQWGYFSNSPRAFSIEKYNVSRPILHSNIHQMLHPPQKMALELHQILRLPWKVTLELHQVLHLPQKVPLELHQILRLPRKATLELHQVLHLPRKVTLELHQILRLPQKVTLELHQVQHLPRKVTLELHQVLHLPRKVTLEFHQVLRLPRKVTLEFHQMLRLSRRKTHMLNPHHISNLIYNARSNRCPPPTSATTAPATKIDTAKFQRKCPKTGETSFPMRGRSEHDPTMIRAWSDHDPTMIRPWNRQSATRLASEVTFRTHHEHFLLKNTTFRAQSYIQTFTKCCTCHKKWH